MPRRIVAAFVPNAESSRGAWQSASMTMAPAAPCSLLFSLPLGCRLFYIGVENGLPSALCHFPNRSGIEGAGGIFSIIGPFDNDLVGAHDGISSNRNDVVIADGERFHVPLLHIVQFLLHIGNALVVNSAEVRVHHFLEAVGVFVFECLPGGLFFCHYSTFVRRG